MMKFIFLHADRQRSFLQVNTIILSFVALHTQST